MMGVRIGIKNRCSSLVGPLESKYKTKIEREVKLS